MAVGDCEFVGCQTPSMPWSLSSELLQSVSAEDSSTSPHGSSSAIGPFVWPDDVSVCSGLEDGSSACKDLNISASTGTDDELARRVGSILLTILEDDSSSDAAQHSNCLSDEFQKMLPSESTGPFSPLCGSCLSGEKCTSPVDKALLSDIIGDSSSGPVSAMPETFLSDSSSSFLPPVVEQLVRLQMTQTASPSNNGDTWSSSKSSTDCLLSDCFPRRNQIRLTGDDDFKSELVLDTTVLKPCVRTSSVHEYQQFRNYSSLVPPIETPIHSWSSESRWYSPKHLVAKSREPPPTKGWTNSSAHTWMPVEKDNRDSFCAQTSFDSGICEDISWSVPCHQAPFNALHSHTDYDSAAVEMPFRQFVNHSLDYGIRPHLCSPSTTMLNVCSDDWPWQEVCRTRRLSPPTLPSNNWTGIPLCCEFAPFFPQPWLQMTSCSRQLVPNAKLIRRNSNAAIELHFNLEECLDEYRLLEKERKKTEADLARNNLGKKINSSNNLPIPRLPLAPTKIDRMLVDFFREHARPPGPPHQGSSPFLR
ncbi:DUF4582 domain containing protein [Trichuris trichiura]|uniref:DUF4582 domain containing protein n=1 Tax=Trichuris trichiura TaxID=36087 RepID=A0A077ZEN0_TRITR|nr:DUF4582 domain containing protein [Trichuris trichiura]